MPDWSLIPFFGAEGAATGYLLAIFIQFILFRTKTELFYPKKSTDPVLVCPVASLASGISALLLFESTWLILVMSVFFYFILLIFSRQIR